MSTLSFAGQGKGARKGVPLRPRPPTETPHLVAVHRSMRRMLELQRTTINWPNLRNYTLVLNIKTPNHGGKRCVNRDHRQRFALVALKSRSRIGPLPPEDGLTSERV